MSKNVSSVLNENRVREIVREELGQFGPKFRQELKDEIVKEIKEPIMDKLDRFISELRNTHEEYDLQVGKISEHSEAIDELDTRVSTLEKRLSAS